MSSVYKLSFCQLLFQSIWDCFGHSESSENNQNTCETTTLPNTSTTTTMISEKGPIYMICVRCSNEMLLNDDKNEPPFTSISVSPINTQSLPFRGPIMAKSCSPSNTTITDSRECRSSLSMSVIQLLNSTLRSGKVNDTKAQTVNGPHRTTTQCSDSVLLQDRMSPSNYCRISTCEQLHIHELTPKCRETFAPSSTCSSCQFCEENHHSSAHNNHHYHRRSVLNSRTSDYDAQTLANHSTERSFDVTLSCALEEYRPNNTPEHLYRIIA